MHRRSVHSIFIDPLVWLLLLLIMQQSRAGTRRVVTLFQLSFVRPLLLSHISLYLHIYVAIEPISPLPTFPRHLLVSPLLLFSLFVWNLLSSWNISSNRIGKSKGTTFKFSEFPETMTAVFVLNAVNTVIGT